MYKLLSERDFELRQLKKRREEEKAALASKTSKPAVAAMHGLHSMVQWSYVFVVVLLFYIHGKQLRSCQDGQLT